MWFCVSRASYESENSARLSAPAGEISRSMLVRYGEVCKIRRNRPRGVGAGPRRAHNTAKQEAVDFSVRAAIGVEIAAPASWRPIFETLGGFEVRI